MVVQAQGDAHQVVSLLDLPQPPRLCH